MTISVLKMHFRKLPPKDISEKDFSKFENERFIIFLQSTLSSQNIDYVKFLKKKIQHRDKFFENCQNVLNHHAPRKKSSYIGIINLP